MNLPKSKYKNVTYLPYYLVEQAFDEGWERSLNYFILLRKVHKKPIYYNFTLKSVGEKLEISHATVRKHLNILKEKGLVRVIGKNLCLAGTSRLLRKHKSFLVPIKLFEKKKDQFTALRFVLIKRNFKYQERGYNTGIDILKSHKGSKDLTPRQVKRLLEKEKIRNEKTKTTVEKSLRNYISLSNQKFGSLCKRGLLTGLNIQKELNRLGLIESRQHLKLYTDRKFKSRKEFFYFKEFGGKNYLNNSYLLNNSGYMYRQLPNLITVK